MPAWKYEGNKISVGGVTEPAVLVFPVHSEAGRPSTLTTGTDTTPTAGTVYFSPVVVNKSITVSKIGYLIGSVGGTDKVVVSLYNAAGALLANSILDSSVTVGSSGGMQEVSLTATIDLNPGVYFAGVSVNGNTCRLRLSVANGNRGGSLAGSFNTLAAITPATSTAAGPYIYLV